MCERSYHAQACRGSGNGPDAEVRREAASLESSANIRGEVAEIRPKLCRSCWCPKCGVIWGWKVRRALTKAIGKFEAVQMWTLTVDPSLFDNDPQAAFDYLKSSKRPVGELVRTLRDQGLLLSKNYFYVIEFHKSGFPHIHIIFDAKRIEHSVVQARWHALGPKTADGSPSTLGIVRYSPRKNRFKNPEHAANYVTKYLIKHPAEGHPDWVMQIRNVRRVNRCGHNKGLFPSDRTKSAKTGGDGPSGDGQPETVVPDGDGVETCSGDESCFCMTCRGANLSTIGERVARCGQATNLFAKRQDADGKPLLRFRGTLAKPFDDLLTETVTVAVGGGIELPWSEAARLEREYGSRDPLPSSMQTSDVEGTPSEPASKHEERMQDRYAEEKSRDVWREAFLPTAGGGRREGPAALGGRALGGDAGRGEPSLRCPLSSTYEDERLGQAGDAGRKGPAGGAPLGGGGEASARHSPRLECDPLGSVAEALVHLRDVHGVTGDQAHAFLDEAIDDLGDDVSRHRWQCSVAEALAGLLGDDDANSHEKGEAA